MRQQKIKKKVIDAAENADTCVLNLIAILRVAKKSSAKPLTIAIGILILAAGSFPLLALMRER